MIDDDVSRMFRIFCVHILGNGFRISETRFMRAEAKKKKRRKRKEEEFYGYEIMSAEDGKERLEERLYHDILLFRLEAVS